MPAIASATMEICVILLVIMSTAMSIPKVPTCGCPKVAPICASNNQMYHGICRMFCQHLYLQKHIHKVHDGPCIQRLFGTDYIDSFWPTPRSTKLFYDLIVVH